jgi:2',3'-cyclic-nucleotide 2'-phosphodiesterase (5'-nucleotidase family)
MNGDWIDGTGLAMDGDPSHIIPLLEKIPFDVVNTGNHELYRSTVVEYMTRPGGFIDWWGHHHLASNIILARTKHSLSNRYILLEGRNSNVLGLDYSIISRIPAKL